MLIGVVDADLLGRKKHRFPNLVCMKISAYYKSLGHAVELVTDYNHLGRYDKVFISMVFTDTPLPAVILDLFWVEFGGTAFYFDKAPNLPEEVEHCKPDYSLYDDFINQRLEAGAKRSEFKEYLDYSIGFLTRGCFRKCGFCVNQKYNRAFKHSNLMEFYDPDKKKICLLDDNFLACAGWKEMLTELIATGKPFKFKQGLDERLLTDEKCELLFSAKYDGDITFAFDDIADYELIHKKLKMIRNNTDRQCIFYVLCGYKSTDLSDIENTFKRIELLIKYHCLPYIMRYKSDRATPYLTSEFRGIYITLARWCNQPSLFKKKSFYEFCEMRSDTIRYRDEFTAKYPEIAKRYFHIKWEVN